MNWKKLILFVITAGLLAIGAFLIPRSHTTQDSPVATTIFPLQDIAQNIAGNTMHVGLIVPTGASPHTFEPTPSTMRDLQSTEIVFAIGHGLDDWTETITANSNAKLIVVDGNVELLGHAEDTDSEHEKEAKVLASSDHDEHEHSHEGTDPHYFLSVTNAIIIAQTMTDSMSAQFPEFEKEFRANASEYIAKLKVTNTTIENLLAPIEGSGIVTLHPAWNYFAHNYNLEIIGSFEPSAGREPTPQYLIELQTALKLAGSTTIYNEPQLSTESIQAFVIDNNLTIAELDPLGGQAGRASYIDLMLYNANTIYENEN